MKLANPIITLLITAFLLHCTKTPSKEKISDLKLINLLNSADKSASLKRIDSVINFNNFSEHQIGLLYYEKGKVLNHLEKHIEAIASFTKALHIFEKEKNIKLVANTNMLLSDSNALISINSIASKHIAIALKIFIQTNNKKGEARSLNSLGHIAYQNKDFEKSIKHVKQAAAIQLTTKDDLLAGTYNNIGFILEQTGDFNQACEYYLKAIALNKAANKLNSNPLRNLGYVYLMQNKYEECNLLYLESLKIEEAAGKLSIQKEIYGVLLEISIKNKKNKKAIEYIAKKDSINELLVKQENIEKVKRIQDQYNLINKKTELIQAKKSIAKKQIIFGILAGGLLLFVLFLIQKTKNSRLELIQEKLILEQKVLRTQMNPHFIFNALTSIQKTIFDNDPIKSASYLSKFAKLIRQNFEFVSKKEILLSEDLDALKNYIETQQLRFDNKFNYEISIDKSIDSSFIKIPPMLIQPFVENAIEHGLKPKIDKGKLNIKITKKDDSLCFRIIDNGIGLDKKNKNIDREHAIDIFKKRLSLRNLGEENLFSLKSNKNSTGTIATFYLKLI